MGAIAGTKVIGTELGGQYKILNLTCVPTSASDTVTLTLASHGISVISAILKCEIQSGQDANLKSAHATYSGLVITVKTYDAAGGVATDWASAVVRLVVLGY